MLSYPRPDGATLMSVRGAHTLSPQALHYSSRALHLRAQRGQKDGVGEYVWPSGAIYRGEWRDGYMHGTVFASAPLSRKMQTNRATSLNFSFSKCPFFFIFGSENGP